MFKNLTQDDMALLENILSRNQIHWINSSIQYLKTIRKVLKKKEENIESPKTIWTKRLQKYSMK